MPATKKSTNSPAREVLANVADRANWDVTRKERAEGEIAFKDLESPLPPGKGAGGRATAGSKRKAAFDDGDGDHPASMHELDLSDVPLPCEPDKIDNCDQIRRKITRLIDSGEMKIGQFCTTIGLSNNAVSRFRGQRGKDQGEYSDVYQAALSYFMRREILGMKLGTGVSAQKKQKLSAKGGSQDAATKSKTIEAPDVSHIRLDGEDTDSVKVFDTCDEVRKKITAHLKKYPSLSKAQFGRNILSCLHAGKKSSSIQGSTIDRFTKQKGPRAGATSNVFYGTYVYFEKLRLAEGKPKSQHREEMERSWPVGFDVEFDGSRGYLCKGDERPYEDKFGRVTIETHQRRGHSGTGFGRPRGEGW